MSCHPVCLVADLALDAQRAAIADFLAASSRTPDVHLPLAQRHLLAPAARRRRSLGVLDVNAANVRAEDFHRPQWIALVVQQHVRRVEVHLQVRALQFVECQAQQVGRLLARLERDRLRPWRRPARRPDRACRGMVCDPGRPARAGNRRAASGRSGPGRACAPAPSAGAPARSGRVAGSPKPPVC